MYYYNKDIRGTCLYLNYAHVFPEFPSGHLGVAGGGSWMVDWVWPGLWWLDRFPGFFIQKSNFHITASGGGYPLDLFYRPGSDFKAL